MASAARTTGFLGCFCSVLIQANAGDHFLKKEKVLPDTDFLGDVQVALGDNLSQLDAMENRLRPMFHSLPKNSKHTLSHAAARYALHRVFVDLNGWNVIGLEHKSSDNTFAQGANIIRGVLPSHIEKIIEKHFSAKGFDLRDLATLASTIDHVVDMEQSSVVRRLCELDDLPTVGPMGAESMREVINSYMAIFLLEGLNGLDFDSFTAAQSSKAVSDVEKGYPGWSETVVFIADEIEALSYNERHRDNPFRVRDTSVDVALRVVKQVARHFTVKQSEPECQEIKANLLTFERSNTGRVRLADFYRAALESRFFFVETEEFLRAIGVLDDTDSISGPTIIVPNYVLTRNNCLSHSRTYSICCINECESLYGKLEQAIVSPAATPGLITSVVAGLTTSVQAPRNISEKLVTSLEQISRGQGGKVFLHSRLFARWMHLAFPRECPYPHITGSLSSMTADEWAQHHDKPSQIDKEDLLAHIQKHDREFAEPDENASEPNADVIESMDFDIMELMWSVDDADLVEPRRSWFKFYKASVFDFAPQVGIVMCVLLAIGTKMSSKRGWARDIKGATKSEEWLA